MRHGGRHLGAARPSPDETSPTGTATVLQHIPRFIVEDNGNDLIEYMLLAALVGTAGALVLNGLPAIMNAVYGEWETATNDLWEPNDPTP